MNRHVKTALAGMIAGLFTASSAIAASGTGSSSGTKGSSAQQRSAQGGQKQQGAQAPESAAPAGVPAVLVLIPTPQASDPNMGNGCWVRFYDHENYKGDSLTLVGPVDMPDMEAPGAAWNEWDSAVVGPKARVTTYDDEKYRDERTATLNPGDRIHDLDDDKLGWFEEIKSAKVACTS